MRPALILLTTLLSFSHGAPLAAETAAKPNVLIILADDLGFSDLGCYGSEIKTPNLDRLAMGGLRFTQFYNTAKCHSSRISLLSGRYPYQAGNRSLGKSITLPEVVAGAGYFTAMTDKWHLKQEPTDFGFQRYFGHLSGATNYFTGNDTFRLNGEPWPVPGPAAQPPNVVVIFADDLGYGDLSCYGATKVQTPHIDSLARDGRRFTDAHSASAVCTPSRYALITGEYPLRTNGGKGTWGPLSSQSQLIIDTDTLTVGKVFKTKGYATAAIGKWHLGFGTGKNDWSVPLKPGPNEVGFDYYFGVPHVNSGSPYVYVENDTIVGYDPEDPLVYGKKPASPTPTFPPEASAKSVNKYGGALKAHQIYDDEKTGVLLTEKATDWITTNKDKPFFLYFPTTNIHHPFTPAPRFKGTSQCGLYGDFIQELDWMVGEILTCLEENGLRDNTLVIFTSDNGGMLNRGGRDAVKAGHKMNGELLGFKFGAWEGGHRVPFIARWPGKIEAGTESDQLICNVDMLATFVALTGQDSQILENKDSINVLPALLENPGEPLRTELLLAPRHSQNLAIRQGKWMYIRAQGSGGFTGSRPNDHAWGGAPAAEFVGSVNSDIEGGKYRADAPTAQLYDLEKDLAQTTNVICQYPEVAGELKDLLDHYRSQAPNLSSKKTKKK